MKISISTPSYQINIEAENILENLIIQRLVKRIKRPIEAFGNIDSITGLAWCFIQLPMRKDISIYDAMQFTNGGK